MEVRYEFTPVLTEILSHLKLSLMVTTYQAGKLLVLGVHDGHLKISFASYDQPMGLAIDGDRLALGTRKQINFLQGNRDVAPSIDPPKTWDVCYVPRTSTWTGSIHGHDLAWGHSGLWVVNTLFSCLSTLHDDFSFVPAWRPPFISQLIDQDRCHLNGLAIKDGVPKFVTAMAETDSPAGWRPTKATSGLVMDVDSGETIARGFAMPHSPRWHNGKLWVLDSGRGALGTIDLQSGQFQTVETFPGYTRGLSFAGQFAFVGLSRIRETSVFGGVPIAERRDELKCGVGVVDLLSGRTVAVFQFYSGVTEIFAVEAAVNAVCPYVAGASTEGKEQDVWIVPTPGSGSPIAARLPWYSVGSGNSDGLKFKPGFAGSDAKVAVQSSTPTAMLEARHARQPNDAVGWVTLGNLYQEQNRQPEALKCYESAVQTDPLLVAAQQNFGYLLFNQGFPERSEQVYRSLLKLDPSPMNQLLASSVFPVVYQSHLAIQQWRQRLMASLHQMAENDVHVDASMQLIPTMFFLPYQGFNDRDAMELRGKLIDGDVDSASQARPVSREVSQSSKPSDRRLKVGFLSAYFRNHTIGRLNLGRIERLDRSRFHVTTCAASSLDNDDAYGKRFEKGSDRFINVPRDVGRAIAMLRQLDLDILVFADVGMDALCSTLAHSRMAPVQCATWGHPSTTGSRTMDYFLSSELLEVADAQSHYTERLVRMRLLGVFYEKPLRPSQPANIRHKLGIPATANLYACPQSLFKLHPDDDDILRGILEADRDGVIVLIEGRVPRWTETLRERWRHSLAGFEHRLRFIPSLPHHEYLSLLQESDVMLDPLHFGGGNSSYEAIAMGTPIVTCPGEFLRSRITAALYRKMGFHDCIVDSPDKYITLAVNLATDRATRATISAGIQATSGRLFEDPSEVTCLQDTLQSLAL